MRGTASPTISLTPGEQETTVAFETIIYEEDGPIGTITLNRPHDGNMFTHVMCHEIRDCINAIRRETRTRVIVITGAGDKFFCIGGRKDGMEDTNLYAGVLPTLEMYEFDREAAEARDRLSQRICGRRRPRAALRVRPHHRQGKRGLSPGRPDDGLASMRATAPGTSRT